MSEPQCDRLDNLRSEASVWLDHWLETYSGNWDDSAGQALVQAAAKLQPAQQIALHLEAVSRLPRMRAERKDQRDWQQGAAVYELAWRLYSRKLPRTETDIYALLHASRHDCGHGEDVTPPFQLALDWARGHGLTPAWLAAVREFVDRLAPLKSAKASSIKTKARLLLLLDTEQKATGRGWSESFRRRFAELPASERAAWARLFPYMSTAPGHRLPKDFDHGVQMLTHLLGAAQVIARLDQWLPQPTPQSACRLDTSGTFLLKNLLWLLLVLSQDPALASACDELVVRLPRVDLQPPERAKPVFLACAAYLSTRPPQVGLEPLKSLRAWSIAIEKTEFNTIRDIADAYKSRQGSLE
jgi:hypothetical protein